MPHSFHGRSTAHSGVAGLSDMTSTVRTSRGVFPPGSVWGGQFSPLIDVAERVAAIVNFVGFVRKPGTRSVAGVFTTRRGELRILTPAIESNWQHFAALMGDIGLQGLKLVTARGEALTVQQIQDELRQMESQRRQQEADNRKAADQASGRQATGGRGSSGESGMTRKLRADAASRGINLDKASEYNRNSSRKLGWGFVRNAYTDAGDWQLAIDVFDLQKWARNKSFDAGKPDGMFGPGTMNMIKAIRTEMLKKGNTAEVDGDIRRIVLNISVPGLSDPVTNVATTQVEVDKEVKTGEPARPVGGEGENKANRTEEDVKKEEAKKVPGKKKPKPRPKPQPGSVSLTDAQIAAAQRANAASAKKDGWTTVKSVYTSAAARQLVLDVAAVQAVTPGLRVDGEITTSMLAGIERAQKNIKAISDPAAKALAKGIRIGGMNLLLVGGLAILAGGGFWYWKTKQAASIL